MVSRNLSFRVYDLFNKTFRTCVLVLTFCISEKGEVLEGRSVKSRVLAITDCCTVQK